MSGTTSSLASAQARTRHVFLRDVVLDAHIGVYAHEHRGAQRVRVNVDLAVAEGDADTDMQDDLARVVDYHGLIKQVRALVGTGHVKLVETLAERIAAAMLADPRVRLARVRVEKLDVFPDAVSAGVEVERAQSIA